MSAATEVRVRILNDQVVNQIAAGEVVERPASVVKELVENSLDAGADEITVSITNGGRSSIEVIDNGRGMSKEDALLAIERFGTSKIEQVEDLLQVATHGFRGEALPSIASVSRFRLSSARQAKSGVHLSIDAGSLREVVEAALAPGTRVEVRHLFHNVPARKKFLRSENTEAGLVRAQLIDFALAYPHVRFRLSIDGQEVANYPGRNTLYERAREQSLAGDKPIELDETTQTAGGEIRVRALLSQPVECVSNSGRLRLLVNRRSVRDKLLLKAVREGYGNFLKPGRYPSGILALDLPPADVDVNVHPQKTEVRFRRPELVFAAVSRAIQKSFRDYQPEMFLASFEPGSAPSIFANARPLSSAEPIATSFDLQSRTEVSAQVEPRFDSVPSARLDRMRYVGQILGCFLVLEAPDRMAVLDMHAAHERVMFYHLKCQLRSGSLQAQHLLIPEKFTLPPEKAVQYLKFKGVLDKLGIETDQIGEHAIVIRSVPALLSQVSPQTLFRELCALPDWSSWAELVENAQDAVLSRMACHRSIRSGRELEAKEAYELLDSLEQAESSGFCPHGRPVVKFFSRSELETMFGRSQF